MTKNFGLLFSWTHCLIPVV